MADENVSALLILDNQILLDTEDDSTPMVGIVTERDLCRRVLAQGMDVTQTVSQVMTHEVISLDHNAYVYEAMLAMLRNNVHHLLY